MIRKIEKYDEFTEKQREKNRGNFVDELRRRMKNKNHLTGRNKAYRNYQ